MMTKARKSIKLWKELKRRNVLRAIAMYAATAFIIMQVSDIMLPRLGLSERVVSIIIVLLIVGLPVVIILSWIFDFNFESKDTSQKSDPGKWLPEPNKARRKIRPSDIIISILFLAILLLIYPRIFTHSNFLSFLRPIDKSLEKSIVILPFDHLSDMTGYEYFAEGVQEDILHQLGNIEELQVISRTTSRQYIDTDKTIPQIAKELNVNFVMEGTIRINDKNIKIVTQLINAHTDAHMMSRDYNKTLSNVIELQNDIAIDIAHQLRATLLQDTKRRILERENIDPEAYDYYLKGNYEITEYNLQNNEKSIMSYRKAIEIEPGYSDAWAGIAAAYVGRFSRYGMDYAWIDSARTIIDKAIEMDAESVRAHATSGLIYLKQGKPENAIDEILTALDYNPNDVMALSLLGSAYKESGNYGLALKWYLEADRRSPIAYSNKVNIGVMYSYFGSPEKAEVWFQQALNLRPESKQVLNGLAHMYLAYGMMEDAVKMKKKMEEFQDESWMVYEWMADITRMNENLRETEILYHKALASNPDIESSWYAYSPIGLGHIHLLRGEENTARELLNSALESRLEAIDSGSEDSWVFHEIAAIYSILGNRDLAMKWLKRATEAGWKDFRFASRDPWFENLHKDPRFLTLMDQISTSLHHMKYEFESQAEV